MILSEWRWPWIIVLGATHFWCYKVIYRIIEVGFWQVIISHLSDTACHEWPWRYNKQRCLWMKLVSKSGAVLRAPRFSLQDLQYKLAKLGAWICKVFMYIYHRDTLSLTYIYVVQYIMSRVSVNLKSYLVVLPSEEAIYWNYKVQQWFLYKACYAAHITWGLPICFQSCQCLLPFSSSLLGEDRLGYNKGVGIGWMAALSPLW